MRVWITTIATKFSLGRVGDMRWMQAKRWLVTGVTVALGVGQGVLAEGLPSRLKVGKPAFDGGKVKLGWEIPGNGWTFRVEESEALGGNWALAPGGEVGTARTWTDATDAVDAGRVFRVVAAPPPVVRGNLVSATKTTTYTTANLMFLFAFAGIPITPQHNVDVYKVVYDTVDPWGLPTRASAAVAVPATAGRSWPLLAYQHGTITTEMEAPSAGSSTEGLLGVVLATSGYTSVLADYLGFGESPGRHPFHHAASTATSVVDAMRACRSLCATNGKALNGQVFLAGYSQGGHATLAVLRELEARHATEFPVTACAAMAGAYDLSGVTLTDALSDRRPPNAYYFAYLLQTLVDLYDLAPSYGSLLVPPYDTTIPALLASESDGGEINLAMPAIPNRILKPEYLAAVREDPDHPLRRALRDNDLTGFVPKAPLRLYHCSGDEDVLPANSVVARDRFTAAGVSGVLLVDPSAGADHGDCVEPALLAAKAWFDSLKQ
jgi:hypothetical protein